MYWKHLSQAYITEESDDPKNPDNISQHKIPLNLKVFLRECNNLFISIIELNEYNILLEKCRDLKGQKEVSGLVAKKSRSIGTPSTSLPPPNAPKWALMRESILNILHFNYYFVGITTEDQENNQENEQVS